jgi:RNA methyltransferase, TrmH family
MEIASRRNETLKGIRRLRRRQGEHALLEGPHLLREAVASGIELESVLLSDELAASPEGEALARLSPRPPLVVAARLLAGLCDADAPRGVLAVARLARGGVEVLSPRPTGVTLFVDGVQDPGNLGALARVAEAFGADGLALGAGSCHPNHPRALRASAGSLLRLPVAVQATPGAIDERWRELGRSARWIGLVAHGGAPLPAAPPAAALLLALGAERGALSDEVAMRLDERWTIPLVEPVESLNVAVAAGVALFALRPPLSRRPRAAPR